MEKSKFFLENLRKKVNIFGKTCKIANFWEFFTKIESFFYNIYKKTEDFGDILLTISVKDKINFLKISKFRDNLLNNNKFLVQFTRKYQHFGTNTKNSLILWQIYKIAIFWNNLQNLLKKTNFLDNLVKKPHFSTIY